MKILGINTSHNASICLLTEDKDLFYFEEERYNRIKYFEPNQYNHESHPFFKCISEHIIEAKNIPDEVIVASYDRRPEPFTDLIIIEHLKEQLKDYPATWHFSPTEHHLYHAICGFHFSGFDEAICVIMDGGGAQEFSLYPEVESIYLLDKQRYKKKYVHATNFKFVRDLPGKYSDKHFIQDDVEYLLSSSTSSGIKFAILCEQFGYKYQGHDAGKLMGLAAYGKSELDPQGLAMKLQIETKKDTIKLLEKAFSYSPKTKNVVLSGGYALNCVNNYEYVKAFPEYNFFVDPVSHDGGTAIGAALWLDRYDTQR
jgi:predicted NodU family carbamoyl transferase